MAVSSKALVKSTTFWGVLIGILPELATGLNEVASSGVVPPNVATTLHLVGAAVATIGRWIASRPISGLFS